MSEYRKSDDRQAEHTLPRGVTDAEKATFDDIISEAPIDGINYGHYDIADHPYVTGEKSVHQNALLRIKYSGRALMQLAKENSMGGAARWDGSQEKHK